MFLEMLQSRKYYRPHTKDIDFPHICGDGRFLGVWVRRTGVTHYIVILSPVILSFNEIGKIVIMVVFGGLGNFAGPLIGAPAIVVISELTRDFGSWNMVFYSLVVIVIMRLYREGLVELFHKGIQKLSGKKPAQNIPFQE